MKVILQKDIPNLGEVGDIKEVTDGYARNFLLPKKMVIVANEKSKKAIEHQRKLIKIKKEKRKKKSEILAGSLSGVEIRFDVKAGEEGKLFGSVTAIDIMKKLRDKGFEIDKRKIILHSPIKELGTFEIPIKLDKEVMSKVSVVVEKEQ